MPPTTTYAERFAALGPLITQSAGPRLTPGIRDYFPFYQAAGQPRITFDVRWDPELRVVRISGAVPGPDGQIHEAEVQVSEELLATARSLPALYQGLRGQLIGHLEGRLLVANGRPSVL